MTFQSGQMLSHYRLVEKIGEGGMGVVWKAYDPELDRDVAVKVLPAELTEHEERRRRFQREARVAAAVNHPYIATIHEVGEQEGIDFLVMELVEGKTLRALLRYRPLSVHDTLRFASEIAEGLAHAHEHRVIHRDLKPENIIVRPDRHSKILDFGLAKLVEQREEMRRSRLSQMDTLTDDVTREGKILGTAAYMSPEQARGEKVDARSDIFSFGVTLYEMLTGRALFHRPTQAETLAAILKDKAIPASDLNADVPAELDRILTKCLEKDARNRYQHTDELVVDLRQARASPEKPSEPKTKPSPVRRKRRLISLVMISMLLISASILIWFWLRPPPVRSVALLPLEYEGPTQQAFLKELLPLALAEGLRASPGLLVAPFASSRDFQPETDPLDVARQLGVRYVVQGQIRVSGEQIVATFWTSRGAEGIHDWSKRIEGDVTRLIGQTDQVAAEIASALGVSTGSTAHRNTKALEHYLRGQTLLEGWDVKKNYELAEEAFRAAISVDEDFAEAYALLARALWTHYMQTRDPELILEAEEASDRALSLNRSLPQGHAARGLVLLARGHSVEAAHSFSEGLRLAPADDSLCRKIARAYGDLGRDDEAVEMYDHAIDLRPSYWNGYNEKGLFYFRRGRLDEAKREFRRVIELRPESTVGYVNLAAAHMSDGEHDEAEPLLKHALQMDPGDGITRNNLGVVYYTMGQFDAAAREWREVSRGDTQNPWFLANLGDAYRQLGRPEEARESYAGAIELAEAQLAIDPEDEETHVILSLVLAGLGRCDQARQHARIAVEVGGTDPLMHYYAAIAFAVCGDRGSAVGEAVHAIEGGIIADVRSNPDLESIRDDPAIKALLK